MNMKLFDYQEEMVERIGKAFGKLQSSWFKCRRGRGKRICLQQ